MFVIVVAYANFLINKPITLCSLLIHVFMSLTVQKIITTDLLVKTIYLDPDRSHSRSMCMKAS